MIGCAASQPEPMDDADMDVADEILDEPAEHTSSSVITVDVFPEHYLKEQSCDFSKHDNPLYGASEVGSLRDCSKSFFEAKGLGLARCIASPRKAQNKNQCGKNGQHTSLSV